ncbi:PAS domain S-box protein [Natronoarchaeum sp. GCM10025703]|uniref:PAS domain S-box protein n=1 Tax=Natronoarchaeum sp. GCM10025703 TaxID=3252685 RepID=UPI003615FCAF
METWNEGAKTLFGYDAETAVGMSMARFHPESDRASGLSDRLLQQARIAGESAHEGWRVRADGSEFYADIRYALLETEAGASRGYAMIVRDMTDRRRQRRRTEQFVEESDDVVSILGPDGDLTYVSGSADRVLGHDPDDLVGENLFDYLHPSGREEAMEHFFSALEGEVDSAEAECRFRSGDGDWLNVEGQCRDMTDDDAIDGVLLYLRDVTDSKEQARQFEGIFNQTFQFTGLLDPDGTVIEANESALEFGGFDREAVVGERFYEAPWWTHSEETSDDIRDAVERAADGEFVRYETGAKGVDGLATLDFSAKPITDEDGEVSLVIVEGRDITQQRQQRQHLEVMQRVMRHNMRNDLTKVEGYTQLLAEETDPDTKAEYLEILESVLDRWKQMSASMTKIRRVFRNQEGSGRGKTPRRSSTTLSRRPATPSWT